MNEQDSTFILRDSSLDEIDKCSDNITIIKEEFITGIDDENIGVQNSFLLKEENDIKLEYLDDDENYETYTDKKNEIDALVMDGIKKATKKNRKGDSDNENDDNVDEPENYDEDDEKVKSAKKAVPSKRKKTDSNDESAGSDNDDGNYSPKTGTPSKKKSSAAKLGLRKDDSNSNGDWKKSGIKNKKDWNKGKKTGVKQANNNFAKSIKLSPALASLMGTEALPVYEVVKKMWAIIKERNLYDPSNKQYAICDDDLMKVIGVKRFRTFSMMKFLKSHFIS